MNRNKQDVYNEYVDIFANAVRAFPANGEGLRDAIMFSIWRIYELGYEDGMMANSDREDG